MSSLWWLCTAQWRRGKGEQRRERGDGSGRDSIGLLGGRGADMAEAKRRQGGVLWKKKVKKG